MGARRYKPLKDAERRLFQRFSDVARVSRKKKEVEALAQCPFDGILLTVDPQLVPMENRWDARVVGGPLIREIGHIRFEDLACKESSLRRPVKPRPAPPRRARRIMEAKIYRGGGCLTKLGLQDVHAHIYQSRGLRKREQGSHGGLATCHSVCPGLGSSLDALDGHLPAAVGDA